MEFDSAIPPHLRVERTQPARTPPNYKPPVHAYSARFPEKVKDIVVAVYGVQALKLPACALDPLLEFVSKEDEHAPQFWDVASAIDSKGYETRTVISYWNSKKEYTTWLASSGYGSWWEGLKPDAAVQGWFKEVFFPPVDRVESFFSDAGLPEGAAHMRESVSEPVLEHFYWGSARDRLPISQRDALDGGHVELKGKGRAAADTTKRRIKVKGQKNLCVIRSGQDWSATKPEERTLYLETMHPVLEKGMNFLRDEGREIGCIENRLMSVLDSKTLKPGTDKTFGLGYFDSLESLEKWSKGHKTHLDIFGRFLKYAKELDNNTTLRLFHEVLVLESDQQDFEYIGCHPQTGLLSVGSDNWLS